MESIPNAVLAVSASMDPLAINPAAETMLGVSEMNIGLIANLMRQNQWLGKMLRTCLESGHTLSDPENVLVVGFREIDVGAEVSPLFNGEGHPEGALILLHDLSHQRNAEHADPGAPNLRLSPAGLAHEVKNPLTGIKGAAELLAAMYPGDARAQQYCGVILEGVNRIASLVEQVLSVSSPQRIAQERINIHQVLHHALTMASLYPASPPDIIIEQEFDPSLPEVIGDAAALERALLNLIRNAADAIGSAGTIRLRTRMETEFRMSAAGKRQQFLRVEVMDSGRGISEADLPQLFTPFFTTKPSGTGLGLVLSQSIIALHGGRLTAERGGIALATGRKQPDRGMTFRIILPIAPPAGQS